MLTDEELEAIWRTADDARGHEAFQSQNVFDLINYINTLQQQKRMLVESLEWMVRESEGSNATTHAKNLLQSLQDQGGKENAQS